MSKEVKWSSHAARDLRRVGDRKMQERITNAVYLFAETGQGDVRKLKGKVNEYRLRVGEWRIRFMIDDQQLTVMLVLRVLPRGDAYSR